MKSKKYYNCFSYKQKNYLVNLGFPIIETRKHFRTKKLFWMFEMTDALSVALTIWSNNKGLYQE